MNDGGMGRGFRQMSREEFFNALNRVILITLAMMAGAYVLLVGLMILTGFKDALLHYTLGTIFTLILAPAGALPLVVMSDRLRTTKRELEGLLRLDALTELPNRRAFFELTEKVFLRGSAVTLMMIDIDHFKQVNDNYGHDTGDRVLRSVAQSIQHIVAETAGAGVKFAARIGGEEFAVLIEGLAADAAGRLANELVLKIEQSPVRGDGQLILVTVSIGVAHRRPGDTPGLVLRGADNACYRAKRLGRNQWRDAESLNDPLLPTPELTAA
jgi:diguanylate cyclase (GGDEF)-like protein